jgi:hypothetical protein
VWLPGNATSVYQRHAGGQRLDHAAHVEVGAEGRDLFDIRADARVGGRQKSEGAAVREPKHRHPVDAFVVQEPFGRSDQSVHVGDLETAFEQLEGWNEDDASGSREGASHADHPVVGTTLDHGTGDEDDPRRGIIGIV